jgi:hypothetical protein
MTYIQGIEKVKAPVDIPLFHQAIILPLPIISGLLILLYFRNKRKDFDAMLSSQQP